MSETQTCMDLWISDTQQLFGFQTGWISNMCLKSELTKARISHKFVFQTSTLVANSYQNF